MTSVANALSSVNSPLNSALIAGLESIDQNDSFTFYRYDQYVLPVDGFVFWVKNSAYTITINGSLHYSVDHQQNSDETIDVNQIIFTAENDNDFDQFNFASSTQLWLGNYAGLKFSFSRRKNLYSAAAIYHYVGDAIYPAMYSQILDAPLSDLTPVVSNSLPIWLSLNALMPVYPDGLVPTNLQPPYASVEISGLDALQAGPYLDNDSSHWQLAKETAKVTIYGLRNNVALSYLDYILDASLAGNFGIMNTPIPFDDVRKQAEIDVRAIKKTIEFEINYYQNVTRTIARKLIVSAMQSFIPDFQALYDNTGDILIDSGANPVYSNT